jgi:hypothetical protein
MKILIKGELFGFVHKCVFLYFRLKLKSKIAIKDETLRKWCVRRVIDHLPPGNRQVVNRVCAMFQIIARFEEDNKMSAKNIALVMNPSMFRYDRHSAFSKFFKISKLTD